MKEKYLLAFMEMTEVFAKTSEANRLKVGACLIKNGNPIAFGVNGTIPGWHTNICEDEEGKTSEYVLHAEIQCLNKLRKINENANGAILLVTHGCCLKCSHEIFDCGIKTVYYRNEFRSDEGLQYLRSKNVEVIKI